MLPTARVDFSNLATGFVDLGQTTSCGLIMTVSVCGRFLVVAVGVMIWIFELWHNEILPWTGIVCPSRVLATAMDTSSHRYAVAALLDGRTGLVCNLQAARRPSANSPPATPGRPSWSVSGHVESGQRHMSSIFATKLYKPEGLEQGAPLEAVLKSASRRYSTFSKTQGNEDSEIEHTSPSTASDPKSDQRQASEYPEANLLPPPIPIESGPRSIYRHLCSSDDPPRSVSICPQRQCVAFGCGAGLELHWVDALTGQDLNRWFPLMGPSDHLYFLPPRQGVDFARTLRLISSAAHPAARVGMSKRFFGSRGRERFVTPLRFDPTLGVSRFWDDFGVAGDEQSTDIGTSLHVGSATIQTAFHGHFIADTDHYRAVPLLDGFHILFQCPETGLLTIGTDAPLGDARRLLRKMLLLPPRGHGIGTAIPRAYAMSSIRMDDRPTASMRTVAMYGDSLVLFSVPGDVLDLSRKEHHETGHIAPQTTILNPTHTQSQGSASATSQPREQEHREWINWWVNNGLPPQHPRHPDLSQLPIAVWPLSIMGTVIGKLSNVTQLAINETDGRLAIWAFTLAGQATAWTVDIGQESALVHEKEILADGRMVHLCSGYRDDGITMTEHSPSARHGDNIDCSAQSTFKAPDSSDMASNLTDTASIPQDAEWRNDDLVVIAGHGIWIDERGVTTMMPASPLSGRVAGHF